MSHMCYKGVTEGKIEKEGKMGLEKRTNKGTGMQYEAAFCYTMKLITIQLCTKFQNHKSCSC